MHRPSPLVMSATDWLLLIALSVLWGGSFYFAKVAVLEIPPLTLALARVLIAGAVIAILIRPLGGAFPRDLATWKMFTVVAALNNAIPFTLIVWGQQYIPIGLALIAGFVGVVVLLGPDLLTEMGQHVWAQIALLVAAFFYALGAIYARRLRGHKPVTIAAGQLLMAAVLLLPLALLIDRPWTMAMCPAQRSGPRSRSRCFPPRWHI